VFRTAICCASADTRERFPKVSRFLESFFSAIAEQDLDPTYIDM